MSRPTLNTRQARHDSAVVLTVVMMVITATVWLVTRLLSR